MELQRGFETPQIDILIVGGGLSGLTSAVKIQAKEKTLNMKLIDENAKIGGQLIFKDTDECGGKWVNTEQEQLIRFLNILHVTPQTRDIRTHSLKRCWDLDRGFTSLLAKFELNRYINMLDMRMANYRPGRSRSRENTPTMQRHIRSRLFFNKSRLFMMNLVELTCGINASDISYDEFMTVLSSCGGLRPILDLYFHLPNTLYELSTKSLLDNLMERIKFTEIYTNRKVVQVKHFKNYVQVIDAAGNIYTTHAVIMAIPWNRVEEIEFEPPIPIEYRRRPRVKKESKRMMTSFLARYNKSWWGLSGYSGNFLCSSPFILGHEQRNTTYMGLVLHEPGLEFSLRNVVLQKLAAHFGSGMLEPVEYHQATFVMSETLHMPQTTPWHRIIWSSSAAVGTYYRNHLGGAVQSGLRGAINAIFLVRPQVVTWHDLIDLDYKNPYANVHHNWIMCLLSRFNLYNVTFYGLFTAVLVALLQQGYKGQLST